MSRYAHKVRETRPDKYPHALGFIGSVRGCDAIVFSPLESQLFQEGVCCFTCWNTCCEKEVSPTLFVLTSLDLATLHKRRKITKTSYLRGLCKLISHLAALGQPLARSRHNRVKNSNFSTENQCQASKGKKNSGCHALVQDF